MVVVSSSPPRRPRWAEIAGGIAAGVTANYVYAWLGRVHGAATWRFLPAVLVGVMIALTLVHLQRLSNYHRAIDVRGPAKVDRPVVSIACGLAFGAVAAAIALLVSLPWQTALVGGHTLWFLRLEFPLALLLGVFGMWLVGGRNSYIVRLMTLTACCVATAFVLWLHAPASFPVFWSCENYFFISLIGAAIGTYARTERCRAWLVRSWQWFSRPEQIPRAASASPALASSDKASSAGEVESPNSGTPSGTSEMLPAPALDVSAASERSPSPQ
jgi:hypothetical protein